MIKLNVYESNLYHKNREHFITIFAPNKKEAREIFKDTIFSNINIKNKIDNKQTWFGTWEECKNKQREILLKNYESYELRGE